MASIPFLGRGEGDPAIRTTQYLGGLLLLEVIPTEIKLLPPLVIRPFLLQHQLQLLLANIFSQVGVPLLQLLLFPHQLAKLGQESLLLSLLSLPPSLSGVASLLRGGLYIRT